MGMSCFWSGKSVLVTGHTGFKGSWLSEILLREGAAITGLALSPRTGQDLFCAAKLQDRLSHNVVDIRNRDAVADVMLAAKPDVVFHLAAQPLVLSSYDDPAYTWETNVMGTINLLEALRRNQKPCASVIVTTDKVYENVGDQTALDENSQLGGHDPYSSSKSATEIAVASWRRSFFDNDRASIVTARAGNVIGGGDWATNRIVPDIVRSIQHQDVLKVRNPDSVRPWQHVLEPLFGYIKLAEFSYSNEISSSVGGLNFGPSDNVVASVSNLIDKSAEIWGTPVRVQMEDETRHEATYLMLESNRAGSLLDWHQRWDFETTVRKTIDWYKRFLAGACASSLMKEQIDEYVG
jgi:CDP-glucose 4,6-dehydratase